MVIGGRGLRRWVVIGGRGRIRWVVIGWRGLIRWVAIGGKDLIRGGLIYSNIILVLYEHERKKHLKMR
jgi:hypothetical protein